MGGLGGAKSHPMRLHFTIRDLLVAWWLEHMAIRNERALLDQKLAETRAKMVDVVKGVRRNVAPGGTARLRLATIWLHFATASASSFAQEKSRNVNCGF